MEQQIKVYQPYLPPLEEYISEIAGIWDNHWLTHSGPKYQKLEEELLKYLKVRNFSVFANGHLSLELALATLGLKGEVITSPYTFISTTQAIVRNGLKPIFCDVRKDNYTIDAEQIESLITENTVAIMPIHVYGQVCDYQKIDSIARKYGLKVIYDAAHAFGVEVNSVGVGMLGDISMFSFHATKVFNTIEGGGVSFNDDKLKEDLEAIKYYGIKKSGNIEKIGTNAKLTEFAAAMGLCNLRHVDEEIEKRKNVVNRYNQWFSDIKGIKFLEEQKGVKSNYAYYPIFIEKNKFGRSRDDIEDMLKKENILTRKYFSPLISQYTLFSKDNAYNVNATPIAQTASNNVLCLPLYGALELNNVDKICKVILRK